MAGATSLEAVKRKIKSLQGQADGAEERAERLQKQLVEERKAREQVSMFTATLRLLIENWQNYTVSFCSPSCVCVCVFRSYRACSLNCDIEAFVFIFRSAGS